jgi:ABC-type transport system involved in multi-copper enzyme maturation permease subunit
MGAILARAGNAIAKAFRRLAPADMLLIGVLLLIRIAGNHLPVDERRMYMAGVIAVFLVGRLVAMRAIRVMAGNAISEAVRNRTLSVVLLFAVVFIISGIFLGHYQPGEEGTMYLDFGLGAITIFGLLIAVFLGVALIPGEVEKRTIYAILAKPVKRWQLVLGKFLGAITVILVVVTIMTAAMIATLYVGARFVNLGMVPSLPSILAAAATTYASLVVLTGLVIMVSTVMSGIMTIVLAFVLWFLGSMQEFIHDVYEHLGKEAWLQKDVIGAIGAVVPNFHMFDLRTAVANGDPISAMIVAKIMLYGFAYTVVVLALAVIFFNQREV